jgi:hypothetical protein
MAKQTTAMTQRLEAPEIVQRLRDCAADPMWGDHCEISKKTARAAADLIVQLLADLCAASNTASEANAQLSSAVLTGDATNAVRDSKLASRELVRLQDNVRSAIGKAGVAIAALPASTPSQAA